jgi:uncharacterized BrkB/YihY/UPF0761 family membrane protein
MSFDPVGFYIPLALAVLYARRVLRSARLADWALMFVATGTTWLFLNANAVAVPVIEAYFFVVIYYIFKNSNRPLSQQLPAGSLITFCFFSMAAPDVTRAMIFHAQGTPATVGGAGVSDHLLLWPIGMAMVYAFASAIHVAPTPNNGGRNRTWREFVAHHFAI